MSNLTKLYTSYPYSSDLIRVKVGNSPMPSYCRWNVGISR